MEKLLATLAVCAILLQFEAITGALLKPILNIPVLKPNVLLSPVLNPEVKLNPLVIDPKILRKTVATTYKFAKLSPTVNIELSKGVRLNVNNLKLNTNQATRLLKIVGKDENLEERMAVISQTVDLMVASEKRLKRIPPTTVNIKDFLLIEGDIQLDIADAKELLVEVTSGLDGMSTGNVASLVKKMNIPQNASAAERTEIAQRYLKTVVGDKATVADKDQILKTVMATADAKIRAKRKVKTSGKWSMPIRYRFKGGHFTNSQKNSIRAAINHWRAQTCIRFTETSSWWVVGAHITFIKGNGCYSKVGRKAFGQKISIGNGCFSMAVIAHEIAHALGFWHEQSRADRDRYVSIRSANIKSGEAHNFNKKSWKKTMTMGVPYDYGSLMHYSRREFSKNSLDTILPKTSNYQKTIGQRNKPSFYDVKLMNLRYCQRSCSGRSSLAWSSCRNDGYRDPKSCGKCRCPEGFAGTYCHYIKTGSPSTCGNKYRNAISTERNLYSPKYNLSPSYRYPANSACQWRIRAPSGTRVWMRFYSTFSFPSTSRACSAYVEVRFGDLARTGPRFCSSTRPSTPFYSHGRDMVLIFRTKGATHRGFWAKFRYERCGGCSGSGTQPVCLRTVRYSCRGRYTTGWWFLKKTHYRGNTCYRTNKYCCSSHNRSGSSKCVPKISWKPALHIPYKYHILNPIFLKIIK